MHLATDFPWFPSIFSNEYKLQPLWVGLQKKIIIKETFLKEEVIKSSNKDN
jgi:hypothetical protein